MKFHKVSRTLQICPSFAFLHKIGHINILFANIKCLKEKDPHYITIHLFTYFLVHLSRRLMCIIVIMCCPSSLTFHIFDFSSERAKRNSTKLDRKQDLNVLYQVCVFRADRKNKMAALASDWLRHFRLLL